MTGNLVTIVRDGKLVNIEEDNLSRGDLVVLQTADIVPADLQLVEANGLEVDEFDITGEIMPVVKRVEEDITIYRGSRITQGTGKGIVTATGEQTEYGKVLDQGSEQNEIYAFRFVEKKYMGLIVLLLTAFIIQVEQSNYVLALIVFYLLLSVVLLLLQNDGLFRYLLITNEIRKLERFDIQIRDMEALGRMSNVDTLCFDKTGVLTTRQIEVKNVYFADGMIVADSVPAIDEGMFHWIGIACALCNDVLFWEKLEQANPVDKALISFAMRKGIDVKEWSSRYERVYDKPFDSENRYRVSGFEMEGRQVYFAKGDAEIIQRMCSSYKTITGDRKKIGLEFWHSNHLNMEAINQSGGTVIALAYSHTPSADYTFLCLLQLENPLQVGVNETMKAITEKGIRSILLTGDRAETAVKVARESGITEGSKAYLIGRTIDRMESLEIARQSAYCSIFARLLPSQKGFLIRLLQQARSLYRDGWGWSQRWYRAQSGGYRNLFREE